MVAHSSRIPEVMTLQVQDEKETTCIYCFDNLLELSKQDLLPNSYPGRLHVCPTCMEVYYLGKNLSLANKTESMTFYLKEKE